VSAAFGTPWKRGVFSEVLDASDERLAICEPMDSDMTGSAARVNAERIIACVNYCAGVEDLQRGSLRALLDNFASVEQQRQEWAEQSDRAVGHLSIALDRAVRAETQRNELAAALHAVLAACDGDVPLVQFGGDPTRAGRAINAAHAALAKVQP